MSGVCCIPSRTVYTERTYSHPHGESRADVQLGNDEDEPLEAESHRVRMNPKNPTSREQQEHEDSGRAVYRNRCAACVEGPGVGGQHRIELLEEEEKDRTTPIVVFDYGFQTGKRRHVHNSDLSRQPTFCEREGPTTYSTISFIVGFIKDLGFRRIILKCDNEPSTKALQDAVIHKCVLRR